MMKRNLVALISGVLFGLGLSISQMINPNKVLAFLDVAGAWDPSLAFVMGGGLVTAFIGFRFILQRPAPILAQEFHLPTSSQIDARLVTGAILFGIGWGLAGYCPGPAIAALATFAREPLVFVIAMLVGFGLYDLVFIRLVDAKAAGGDGRQTH